MTTQKKVTTNNFDLPCPKNYGHFDQTVRDCPICGQALLYQSCSSLRKEKEPDRRFDRQACAGWNDDDGANSCQYYQLKHQKG